MKARRTAVAPLVAAISLLGSTGAIAQDAPPLPAPLRLEEALRIARDHRAEIAAARARARAAAHRPAIVSALEDPMVSPSVDHLPFMLGGADVSVSVEQRFPLSGVLRDRRRAAEADALRVRADADRAQLDVELDAANAFLMLQERREMSRVLEEQRKLAQQFVRAATARYASGAGTHAEALRAEIEVARLDSTAKALAAEVRAAEVMLMTSLGVAVDAVVPPLDGTISQAPPPTAEAAREAARARRPELRAGGAEVARAQAEVSVMRSMYAPMWMVRTGPAYTMSDGPGWMLMVGVSFPLWREKLHAGVAEANAMVEMARADLLAMQRMVDGDAAAAREQVAGARERYLALRDEVVPRAQQAIDPTLAGYASGQLPLVSALEAAQALWSAQSELISSQFELGVAWARLRRATADPGVEP